MIFMRKINIMQFFLKQLYILSIKLLSEICALRSKILVLTLSLPVLPLYPCGLG